MRDAEGALLLDVLVDHGKVAGLFPAGHAPDTAPRVALQGRHLWPAFIDMHTHLDCGHAIPRVRPDGTIHGGFSLTAADWPRWSDEDMALRMEFGLKCAHAHGVAAIRSHVDSETLAYAQHHWRALDRMRRTWAGRVDLQGVTICAMEAWVGPEARALADLTADMGGILGGVTDTLERGENGTYDALSHALDRSSRWPANAASTSTCTSTRPMILRPSPSRNRPRPPAVRLSGPRGPWPLRQPFAATARGDRKHPCPRERG